MKRVFYLSLLFLGTLVYGQDGAFVETNGVKLYYEADGQGEPLVLLHGGTMTHDMWSPWVNDLSKAYRVISVDLRGHGQSSNPTNDFTFSEVASDIFGLLGALNIDKFRAMGFSGGGMTLIHMATMHPDRVLSLVLIGAAPYFTNDTRKYMRQINYDYVAESNPGWLEYMQSVQPGGEQQIRNVLTWYPEAAKSYDGMNFTPPYLSTINCPTLIIHGDEDRFFPVDIPVVLHEAIPNSHLWIIPNFAHSTPQFGTDLGNLFLSTITEFMAGNWD